jgi:integrase
MAESILFTQKRIAEIPRPASGRAEYRDAKTKGLTVRVSETGSRSFYFFGRANGRVTRLTLGSFPEMSVSAARDAVAAVRADVYRGKDPAADRRTARSSMTLNKAFKFYMEHHAKPHKRESSRLEDEAMYRRYLKSEWGSKRINAIRRGDVASWHLRVGEDHGIYAANRAKSLLSKVLSVAIDAELLPGPNPLIGIRRFHETSRDRFLDAAELKAFFAALNEEPPGVARDFVELALLVGARRSNLAAMRWEDIDRGRGVWRIPLTKSGEAQVVPLSAAAMGVLEDRWRARPAGCPWVFPTIGARRSESGHLTRPLCTWTNILERAGLKNVRLHDLRRTLASWQAMLGTTEIVIGKSLGHAAGSRATRVYTRLQNDVVRESVDRATDAMYKAAGLLETEGAADE